MADIKQKFGASTALTITLASLANNAQAYVVGRESTAVDNSTDLFVDAMVMVKVKTGAANTAATGYVNVYAYGSEDGTNFNDTCTGSDAAVTLNNPTQLRLIGVLNTVANATTYEGLFSVAQAFGGRMPRKWGIVIENKGGTSQTLDATGGNHACTYTGISYQSA